MNILVIHGPNLNLLGKRQPEIYGTQTLENINQDLIQIAQKQGVTLRVFQSNQDGEIVSKIGDNIDGISGATLSVNSVSKGMHKLSHLIHEIIKEFND